MNIVNVALDSGLITVEYWKGKVHHWESVSERWVEGGSDGSDGSEESWAIGRLKEIFYSENVYRTSHGFCVHLSYAMWIGFYYLME